MGYIFLLQLLYHLGYLGFMTPKGAYNRSDFRNKDTPKKTSKSRKCSWVENNFARFFLIQALEENTFT